MEIFIIALHIVLCFFLILVVLLQPGKGADFGAAMGGASQEVLGAGGSVSLLAKVTTAVAALFMGTSLTLAWFSNDPGANDIGIEGIQEELGASSSSPAPTAAETTDEASVTGQVAPSDAAPAGVEAEEAPPAEAGQEAPAAGADEEAPEADGEDEGE